jgi:uncharacterized membrane protein
MSIRRTIEFNMGKGRLEAFSDGVLAIVITIMVLELKVPHDHGQHLSDLRPLVPVFLSYILSFVYVGIYWNNHHHMLHATQRVSGAILWANLHLLFWLSLIPFTTDWMGQTHFAPTPTAMYGAVLLLAGIAYLILERAIVAAHPNDSVLITIVQKGWKEWFSVTTYAIAIPLAFVSPWISGALYVLVAVVWFVPDRRIERQLQIDPAK